MAQSDIQLLTLDSLRLRCAQESERFFKRQVHDPRYCFELLRRAIQHGNQLAWEHIYAQYQPLVAGWVERHPLSAAIGEDTEFFVNWAFEKMWTVMTPEKFSQFPNLKSVLRYLQMCVHSILVDYHRGRVQETLTDEYIDPVDEPETLTGEPVGGASAQVEGVEERVVTQVQRETLWNLVASRLKDDKERQVVYATYVLALKPREIAERYASTFRSVEEIYQVKENVLDRLRRDAAFTDFLED